MLHLLHRFLFIVIISSCYFSSMVSLHFLHLSFHKGCINEIKMVAHTLGFQVTSLFIPDIPAQAFDGTSSGNALYNIGHERAANIWHLNKDYFNSFDGIITSDTAPLARIFLQNNYEKPIIVWICNRFDYSDTNSLDCNFPDEEYYQLLQESAIKKNVYLVPYTAFESFYAAQKNVLLNHVVIKPSGMFDLQPFTSAIPADINKQETFFIPAYLNDIVIPREQIIVPTYKGRYNGPDDLKDFKGIIHIPYAWSNLALFENINNGIPYFVPSYHFMKELLATRSAWWVNGNFFNTQYSLAEWYNNENKDIITYFDSWDDLNYKLTTIDFAALKSKIVSFAHTHKTKILNQWQSIINNIRNS